MATADLNEVIISRRKDEEHLKNLNERLKQFIKLYFGDQEYIKLQRFIPAFSYFVYFSCTNVLGVQTLGEEYVGLLQINSHRKLPSLFRRLAFIFIDTFLLLPSHYQFLNIFPFGINFKNIFKVKFCLFLIAGISYLSIRPQQNKFSNIFRFIIIISMAIKLITIALHSFKQFKLGSKENELNELRKCNICYSNKQQLCLPCGHVFCIQCIPDFIDKNNFTTKCAYCRKIFDADRLIPLLI
ncbi:RING-type domain-containing protein [Meloidogyne graminicola]|uniref:RING-type E3 ubiquitin transferase n=1 Tax=Meloidogyne graminicola TaxID=189291 RepID=A0A8S9ZUV1_9BILA|nr:RING-type domain-containing protein [Meloidogyne graminicola]